MLSKILASHLKKVIENIVSVGKTAFVPRRSIIDEVVVVNELLDLAKRSRMGCIAMKIDFDRVYDCVSWDFLRYLFLNLNFGVRWMEWMESLVFKGSMSILINVSATKDFMVGKWLRQ